MQCRVALLPTAWEDLKKIEDYYAVKYSVEVALKVSNHIVDTIERLEMFPDSGSLTPDPWLNAQGYRMVICEKYIAVFKNIENIIYVYHIANTQTEYTKLFI